MANNIICKTKDEARDFPCAEILFYGCSTCGYAWNAAYDASLLVYDDRYENNQSCSDAFKKHLSLVIEAMEPLGDNLSMVEIGCGQGYFINFLISQLGERVKYATGFDPAVRRPVKETQKELISGAFAENILSQNFPPTLAVSRHVIEHLEKPLQFVSSFASCPSISKIVIETPSLNWILENNAYYDFYYEHCSLFMPETLQYILSKNGFSNSRVLHMFGGQYLLALGQRCESSVYEFKQNFSAVFSGFFDNYETFLRNWNDRLNSLNNEFNKVAIWGAASKAVAFTNMLGKNANKLTCAIDINPAKQGNYLPGSALPVVSPNEAEEMNIQAAIVANPLYFDEVSQFCKESVLPFYLLPLT